MESLDENPHTILIERILIEDPDRSILPSRRLPDFKLRENNSLEFFENTIQHLKLNVTISCQQSAKQLSRFDDHNPHYLKFKCLLNAG